MKEFSKTNYHYFFFILLFITQIFIFDDYGYSHDEHLSRLNGLVSYNYIIEKFGLNILQLHTDIPRLENYMDNDYGVVFELFLVFFEKIFNLQDSKNIYLSRHLFVSLSFFIGCIFFYLTLRKFFSKELSLIGTLIFLSHPRIFAQSFYNSKDIIFLVFFCVSNFFLINFFLKQNLRNIIFLSVSISLAVCVRPMALIIPFLFLFFFIMENLDKSKSRNFILLIPFFFFTSFFTILFWPFLWDDPSKIFEVLKSMSKFRFVGEVFFDGEYFVAKYMPWTYIPITILITTPIYQILIFIIGFFFISKTLLNNFFNLNNSKENIWKNKIELFLLYSLIIIFLTIILIIELNATVYTGWRQIYFIYPSIIFVCVFGLNKILQYKKFNKYTYLFLAICLFSNIYSLISNHPYQYTYYNSLITKKNIKNFELDYWGVSNLDLLKKIDELSDQENHKIYKFSVNSYDFSLNMLNKEIRNKYIFVENLEDAEFILSNHYYQDYYYKDKYNFKNRHPENIENYLNKNFNLVYEIKSNNVRINSIYKKK